MAQTRDAVCEARWMHLSTAIFMSRTGVGHSTETQHRDQARHETHVAIVIDSVSLCAYFVTQVIVESTIRLNGSASQREVKA